MTAATENDGSSSEQQQKQDESPEASPSLIIPITSASSSSNFVEIFPEELVDIPSSVLMTVLRDENCDLSVWADAALAYMQQKQARECSALLQAACDLPCGNRDVRVRILASAGIAHLTHQDVTTSSTSSDANEELRALADNRFTQSSKVDTLFPMQWIGRGMLNLSIGRMDQARFFFETTLKQCGQVLPALLGMAAVLYHEKDYKGAQDMYGKAIALFPPHKNGSSTRVGFALACYKLGQVDRAKAAFARALAMDPENVNAMVGAALLDMGSLDETSKDFRARTEKAIKMMSMANLLDHSNAMVQNHLANHYFWKWTPVAGTVSVTHGSTLIQGSQPIPLDPGDRIRIGSTVETFVTDTPPSSEEATTTLHTCHMHDAWMGPSATSLKLWKKDYDRVIALAKGAHNSTQVPEIQAESLFLLARVHHARDDVDNAHKFYERACKLAPDLVPARFGLAQTLVAQEEYDAAAAHLRLVLGTSSATATDALALLGLLEVKQKENGTFGNIKEGLGYLKKAIDLDPLNPKLILLEALALQQRECDYPQSLERYKKAVQLMTSQDKVVPYEIFTNIGVLCHETKKYKEAEEMYTRALEVLDKQDDNKKDDNDSTRTSAAIPTLDNVGIEGGTIRHPDNAIFFGYCDTNLKVAAPPSSDDNEEQDTTTNNTILKLHDPTADAAKDVSFLSIRVGDHVKLGETFQSEIVEIISGDDGFSIRIKDEFVVPPPSEEDKEDSQEREEQKLFELAVKRENNRLRNPTAISIAFNIARLHEASGRTLAAVELHKAILKRNPAYVNCYQRLACIARDCGSLKECSEWLKLAVAAAPGNAEVLTLVGNLHLSLCDWAPAQSVFDQLLSQKVSNVEAYSMLSLGNIYFNNLKTPGKYAKHLQYAADYYKRILTKDKANAYAANGLGTVLAEKGELFKAKEVFDRVREVSGDTIADAHLNLAHIYLAQKKHPQALQMYQSYMNKAQDSSTPITSKSREDDDIEVLLYIAFAYFDWARQTELFNDARAAPADERYKKCIEHLELAMKKSKKENTLLRYNCCMAKLQAANCVLQKLTRNIRRTAQEVEDALKGLEESLPVVQNILQWKVEGKKVLIGTSMLQDFITHCKANIESAKSHLEEERKRESEANEIRELQRLEAEARQKEREIQELQQREEDMKRQEEQERKARAKMEQVQQLRATWEEEAAAMKAAAEKKKEKNRPQAPGVEEEDGIFDNEVPVNDTAALFEDSDEDEDEDNVLQQQGGDANAEMKDSAPREDNGENPPTADIAIGTTEKDLFGDSSDEESDEELVPAGTKRPNDTEVEDAVEESAQPAKKRRVLDDDDE